MRGGLQVQPPESAKIRDDKALEIPTEGSFIRILPSPIPDLIYRVVAGRLPFTLPQCCPSARASQETTIDRCECALRSLVQGKKGCSFRRLQKPSTVFTQRAIVYRTIKSLLSKYAMTCQSDGQRTKLTDRARDRPVRRGRSARRRRSPGHTWGMVFSVSGTPPRHLMYRIGRWWFHLARRETNGFFPKAPANRRSLFNIREKYILSTPHPPPQPLFSPLGQAE